MLKWIDNDVKNKVENYSNDLVVRSQRLFTVPQELLEEAMKVLQDLRRSGCPIEQIRPLSISEAAKALRCRRKEVERLIRDGVLPYVERHSRRYVLPADIHRRLREETERQMYDHNHRNNRPSRSVRPKMEDIDPSLKEFFD